MSDTADGDVLECDGRTDPSIDFDEELDLNRNTITTDKVRIDFTCRFMNHLSHHNVKRLSDGTEKFKVTYRQRLSQMKAAIGQTLCTLSSED